MPKAGIRRARGRPKRPRTVTEKLREDVQAAIGWCACCSRALPGSSITKAAKAAGVPMPSLHQFLRYEKSLSGANIDKMAAWLDKKP